MVRVASDARALTAAPGAAARTVATNWPLRLSQGLCAALRTVLIYGEAARLCPPPESS